jgi:hypothetical protein
MPMPISAVGFAGRVGVWCCTKAVRFETRVFYRLIFGTTPSCRIAGGFVYKTLSVSKVPLVDVDGSKTISAYGFMLPLEVG